MLVDSPFSEFKTYDTLAQLPYIRLAAFEALLRQAEMKIRDTNLDQIFDQIINLAIEKDFANITKVCAYAKAVVNQKSNTSIDLQIGSLFCVMEGEDEKDLQEFWTKKKIELAESNIEIAAFFLTIAQTVKILSKISSDDIMTLDYLNQTMTYNPQLILDKFLQTISKT